MFVAGRCADERLVGAVVVDRCGDIPAGGFLLPVVGATQPVAVDAVGRAALDVRVGVVDLGDRGVAVGHPARHVAASDEPPQSCREDAGTGLHRDERTGIRVGEQPTQRDQRIGVKGVSDQ
ncbi:hypothetical protein GCM10009773_23130 [Williamsia serinedens]